jgi:shikimate kinase
MWTRRERALAFHCRSSTAYCDVRLTRSIVLIGFMGTGKSLVGRALEKETGCRRFDTDEMVSLSFNMSIQEIFSKHGEEKFREAETEALQSLDNNEPTIIVTGGGAVTKTKNIDLLKGLGTVVWLDADHATLRARLNELKDRPLLRTPNPAVSLSELLHARNPHYKNTADIRVDISNKNPEEIADLILKSIENFPTGD